ncbi:uncharacterized protein K460DRAFT_433300 [Cucurbitaria berberidis CBS 394.84]|uniref:Uncharacterized protein n=1 Tax=Cucurbitaria berberidis CBS 394.84 TaxID=1168544 RepID=A0A9P4L653_9PLEO|nr:uncharacterized protein K460DRAFT_433300 [Cucurbitaria berberidis CBS 394.84]KAF1843606.1 hypothetical protein K460DRAFT_433300 [Cucurbitaria berberidis CBS 394.84]
MRLSLGQVVGFVSYSERGCLKLSSWSSELGRSSQRSTTFLSCQNFPAFSNLIYKAFATPQIASNIFTSSVGFKWAMSPRKMIENTAGVHAQENKLKNYLKKKPWAQSSTLNSKPVPKIPNENSLEVERPHAQHYSSKAHGNRRDSTSGKRQTPPTPNSKKKADDALALERVRNERRELERGLSIDSIPDVDGEGVPPIPPPHDATAQCKQSTRPIGNGIPSPKLYSSSARIPPSTTSSSIPGHTVVPPAVPYSNHVSGPQGHNANMRDDVRYLTQGIPEPVLQDQNSMWQETSQAMTVSLQQQRKPVQQPTNVFKRKPPEVGMPDVSLDNLQKASDQALQVKEMCIRNLEIQLSDLRHAHDNASANVTIVDEENTKLKAEILSWQKQFEKVNQELLQTRSEVRNKVDDKWLLAQWDDLHAKIENLSHLYFVGRPTKVFGSIISRAKGSLTENSDSQASENLKRLTREHAQYTGSNTQRPLIVQAFIWWTLTNSVFNHKSSSEGGLLWAGQTREPLYSLQNELRPLESRGQSHEESRDLKRLELETQSYHKWRATTSIMLSQKDSLQRRTSSISFIIADIITDIMKTVSPLIQDHQRPAVDQDIQKQLHTILHTAIELDSELSQQRAWIFCEQRGFDQLSGFPFDNDAMEMTNDLDHVKNGQTRFAEPCVELMIRPALFRAGNQYGEGYSARHVLSKAKVMVRENLATRRRG